MQHTPTPSRPLDAMRPGRTTWLLHMGFVLATAMTLCTLPFPAKAASDVNFSLEGHAYHPGSWGLLRHRDTGCRDSQGCFNMAQVSASTADQFGLPTDITVSNAAELTAALDAAQDGITIRLLAGHYGNLELFDFARDVTLLADRDSPAILDGLNLTNVTGLTFDGLVFDYTPDPGTALHHSPFGIRNSQDVTIRNALFDGADAVGTGTAGDGYGTGTGLGIGNSSRITLENSEITGFMKGIKMGSNEDITIRGNDFNDMRSDALSMGSGMTNVLIENNHFHDMRAAPGTGDHNDTIQLMSHGADTPTSGLTVRGNIFDIGTGTGSQALFLNNRGVLRGAGEDMYYRDFVIEDNLIINTFKNGLFVGHVDGLVVRNNTVLHTEPLGAEVNSKSQSPVISVHPDSRNVVISDNVAHAVNGYRDQPDWTVSDNVIVQNTSTAQDNHYSEHFVNPTGHIGGDLGKLIVRPDSIIAEQGAGASILRNAEGLDALTPVVVSAAQADNLAAYDFDATMTVVPGRLSDVEGATFLWDFGDGTTAEGIQVQHRFAGPGTYNGSLTVTLPDGTTAVTQTVTVVRDSNVLSFDADTGAMMKHDVDGQVALADAPLVAQQDGAGRYLDLGALDTALQLPSALLDPVHDIGRMEIDMRIAGLPGNNGSGEIMRQHGTFVVTVQDGEIKLALNQADGDWGAVVSSGARLGTGLWRDVTLVHDATEGRLEIWLDGQLNAETDGIGAMHVSGRSVTLGGAFSRSAFDGALERFEVRTDPDMYDFAAPPGPNPAGLPEPGTAAPSPDEDALLDRPDLDTLFARIEDGTSDLSLRVADPDGGALWADHGGSLMIGSDAFNRLRDRGGDDVMYGGAGADQFVFDMRHGDTAQTDRALNLDFSQGDALRFLPGDGARGLWFRSEDSIRTAVDDGTLTATLHEDAGFLELALAKLPQHVVQIDLHDGFTWVA